MSTKKFNFKSFTFNSHPTLIGFVLTFIWSCFALKFLGSDVICNYNNISTKLLISFVALVLPSWIGFVFSKKKFHYLLSIAIIGSLWMVGLVAYGGMDCG